VFISIDKLKILRKEKGWSQEVLATASGLSARTIQRIEANGKASAESVLAIASVFNLSPQALAASSDEIEVNWTRKVVMKNLMALLVIAGAIGLLVVLGASAALFTDVYSAIFIVLYLYAATIIAFGSDGMIKSIGGIKYLFTDELVGGKSAKYLAKIYASQVKFTYGGALIGTLVGFIAIFGNIDTWENFIFFRATAVALVVLFYAAIIAECIFRPLSIKLQTADMTE